MGMQAVELYRRMPSEFLDERAHICVLNGCSHSGLMDEARSIFEKVPRKTERIYTTMVRQTLCIAHARIRRVSGLSVFIRSIV